MVPAILGTKVGMTQVSDAKGQMIPVTVVAAGPCVVLQVKRVDGTDQYNAVQLGYEDVKPHRTTLATIGLSVLPPPDEPNKLLAVVKIVGLSGLLLGAGVVVYAGGRGRRGVRSEK